MSLAKYIPFRNAILRHGNTDMPAIAIKGFTIEITRLIAFYEIWVNVNDASSLVEVSDNAVTSGISMAPTDMDEAAIFIIDGASVPCVVKHYDYHHIKHAYLVKIEFALNKNEVLSYVFDEDGGKTESRFDILDL